MAAIERDPAAKAALVRARALIGLRALVRHRPGTPEPCVILRAEQGLSGRRYEIEYGRGSTWAIALQRAAEGYQAMVNEARRKKAG